MILSVVRILSLIYISNNPSSLLLIYSVFRGKQILIVAYKWTKYSNAFSSSVKASTVITVKYYSHSWLVNTLPSSQHLHVLPTLTDIQNFLKRCLLMTHDADISNTIHPKDLKTLWNALHTFTIWHEHCGKKSAKKCGQITFVALSFAWSRTTSSDTRKCNQIPNPSHQSGICSRCCAFSSGCCMKLGTLPLLFQTRCDHILIEPYWWDQRVLWHKNT